jgi:hypothetical protein
MAVDAVTAQASGTAAGTIDAQELSATTEGAAAEGAVAEGAATEQICAPDSSDYSMQLMAAYALAHKVWEQNWETIVASDSGEGADVSYQGWK